MAVFFTGDTHFSHAAIIAHAGRALAMERLRAAAERPRAGEAR